MTTTIITNGGGNVVHPPNSPNSPTLEQNLRSLSLNDMSCNGDGIVTELHHHMPSPIQWSHMHNSPNAQHVNESRTIPPPSPRYHRSSIASEDSYQSSSPSSSLSSSSNYYYSQEEQHMTTMESPRTSARRGTWKPPNVLVFAPTSPHRPDLRNRRSHVTYDHSTVIDTTQETLMHGQEETTIQHEDDNNNNNSNNNIPMTITEENIEPMTVHDDSLMDLANEFSNHVVRGMTPHQKPQTQQNGGGGIQREQQLPQRGNTNAVINTISSRRRVSCDESRPLPTHRQLYPVALLSPRGVDRNPRTITTTAIATTTTQSITTIPPQPQRKALAVTDERPVVPSLKMKKTQARPLVTTTTTVKQTTTIDLKKTARRPSITDRLPLSARTRRPTHTDFGPPQQHHLQVQHKPKKKVASSNPRAAPPQKMESVDPFVITTSPEVARSKQWLELIMEKKKSGTAGSAMTAATTTMTTAGGTTVTTHEIQPYKTARLAELENDLKSSTEENMKVILELQMANYHLKNVAKLILEFGTLVQACETKHDWCSTIEQFLSLYSHIVQNRYAPRLQHR